MACCIICFEECAAVKTISCGDCEHTICQSCCTAYSKSESEPINKAKLVQSNAQLLCPQVGCGNPLRFHDLAKILDDDAFGGIHHACMEAYASKAIQETRENIESRTAAQSNMSADEAKVAAFAEKVREEILTLRCPNCQQAWANYDGCAALKCARCATSFCALCQVDCGNNANFHVANCKWNPGSNGTFVSSENFAKITKRRKLEEISGLLDAFPNSKERKRALQSILIDCKHNGLDTKQLRLGGVKRTISEREVESLGIPAEIENLFREIPPELHYTLVIFE